MPRGANLTRRINVQPERTLEIAAAFLEETRRDLERATAHGCDMLPRLRTVHFREGHATPEYRTLAIPNVPGTAGASPEILGALIARFALIHPPTVMALAFDCVSRSSTGASGPVLIAEVRDIGGTRAFWLQPFTVDQSKIIWGECAAGGWQDPGEEEMILDKAFVVPATTMGSASIGREAVVPDLPQMPV